MELQDLSSDVVDRFIKGKQQQSRPVDLNKNPKLKDELKHILEQKWSQEIENSFTQSEIVYLNTLYRHALLKRIVAFESKFWDTKVLAEDLNKHPYFSKQSQKPTGQKER